MANKKFIIIGNGPAGISAGAKIRQLSSSSEIIIFSDESLPYYARPRLPDLIAGKISEQEIILYNQSWYHKQNIQLNLDTSITKLDPNNKTIYAENNAYSYDKLLLALGANPNLPLIPGIDLPKVFLLRTIADAKKIISAAKTVQEITIIGGGLLSLEIANAFCQPGRRINILERSTHLLARQLTPEKSLKLQNILAERGMCFYLNETSAKISKNSDKLILKTIQGKEIISEIIIVCAGVNQRIDLAKAAGLSTEKGILVNNFLQTSHVDIYAAGDCIQADPKYWGFVKSAKEQGEIAASNMVNANSKEYNGTQIEIILKVTGIDLKTL